MHQDSVGHQDEGWGTTETQGWGNGGDSGEWWNNSSNSTWGESRNEEDRRIEQTTSSHHQHHYGGGGGGDENGAWQSSYDGNKSSYDGGNKSSGFGPYNQQEDISNTSVVFLGISGISQEELKSCNSKFGNISKVKVLRDQDGNHKGIGFVEFETRQAAENCINAQISLNGRQLTHKWSNPKPTTGQGPAVARGGGGKDCFICHQPGHFARECPNNTNGKDVCFKCGESGHISKFCKKDVSTNGSNRANNDNTGRLLTPDIGRTTHNEPEPHRAPPSDPRTYRPHNSYNGNNGNNGTVNDNARGVVDNRNAQNGPQPPPLNGSNSVVEVRKRPGQEMLDDSKRIRVENSSDYGQRLMAPLGIQVWRGLVYYSGIDIGHMFAHLVSDCSNITLPRVINFSLRAKAGQMAEYLQKVHVSFDFVYNNRQIDCAKEAGDRLPVLLLLPENNLEQKFVEFSSQSIENKKAHVCKFDKWCKLVAMPNSQFVSGFINQMWRVSIPEDTNFYAFLLVKKHRREKHKEKSNKLLE